MSTRRASSSTVTTRAALARPMPRAAARTAQGAASTAARLPSCAISSLATSTALAPPAPVPSTTASNSASDKAPTPRAHRRSRGRSATGQSRMATLIDRRGFSGGRGARARLGPSVNSGAMTSASTARPTPLETASPLRRVVLGLTGGIAAYKAAELTRLFVQAGITVDVVMTPAACQFIAPLTLQALSGRPVLTDLWNSGSGNGMGHIDLSRGADAIVIAPASADFIAKLAHGHADDLLSTLCCARDVRLFVAPAMNRQMWSNAATQRNVEQLRNDGVAILGPDSGDQACGEVGMGRMLEPEAIFDAIVSSMHAQVLAGKRVLMTAGPTFEPIDPVRGITNASSGKMGYALARAAAEAGATVTMVSGPTALQTPAGVMRIDVRSAAEMAQAVDSKVDGADIF